MVRRTNCFSWMNETVAADGCDVNTVLRAFNALRGVRECVSGV